MGKQQKKTASQIQSNEMGFSFDKIVPVKFQTPVLLLLILVFILLFFSPVTFGDKTTSSGDLIQVKSLREYATKDRDNFSLWNPYIFCGMPAVATSMSLRWFDFTAVLYSYVSRIYSAGFQNYNAIYTFSFVILAFTAFFFMRSLGASRGISFIVSIGTAFSSGIVVLYYIGHISKLMSLAVFPFILMMLFRFQKKITLIEVLLFTLALHVLILGAHVQIVFYFGLSTLIYFIYFFIRAFSNKDKFLQKQLLKSLGIAAAAGIIAVMMSFDTYAQLYQYKPYSTRGTKSISEQSQPENKTGSDSYEYNTSWSFSPGEVLTFIVPSYYGFGTSTYKGPLTNNQSYEVHTYFGQMTTVDMPMYFGVVIFALALFALFTRWKEPIVQFFGILVVLYIFISFGKNFPLIFNLFYYYFPMFNNFRVPSMILHITQLFFPILAGFGLMKLISMRKERNLKLEKVLRNTAIVFAGLLILSFLLGGSLSGWFSQRVKDYATSLQQSQNTQYFNALSEYITNMFISDLHIALTLVALTFGICYFYVISKINKELLVTGIAILIIFDLFRIGERGSNYVASSDVNRLFSEPDYIVAIKQKSIKEPYRIFNIKQDGSYGSINANLDFHVYFMEEDFFGYSAVKPRTFQDIVETVGPVNPTLWRMLGVKFVITQQPFNLPGMTPILQTKDTFVYSNNQALPRVYFVDSVAEKSPMEMLTLMKNNSFDPKKLAFVDKLDFNFNKADSNCTSVITQYKDESVTLDVNATGNNFLFFGDTYLPGWKAFIDGKTVKTHKADYGFIGIIVPQGKHKVEFVYDPEVFEIGKTASLILNILLFGGIIVTVFVSKKKTGKVTAENA